MIDPLVRMKHVRMACMCSRGARVFFRRHGLDWREFLQNGLPCSVIERTGDGMALRVVEVARRGQ